MTPEQLSDAVVGVLRALVDEGALELPDGVPAEVKVERPRQREHGDYATNVALQLGKRAGLVPRELAATLAGRLAATPGISGVEVAGPGFLNLRVEAGAQGDVARTVVELGTAYGRSDGLAGRRYDVEFISANPTGPLHLGHTRWAVVGDALSRVLEAAGAEVTREFYINDRGNQMNLFGASIEAAALGLPVPDDGYHGAYIKELAQQIVAEDDTVLASDERLVEFRERGYARQLAEQQAELARFNTVFDVWFSERSLHANDDVAMTLEKLKDQGHVYEADGALWMRTTDFGDDKDRVLIRSNGELTYFASDTAYYLDKRSRGFDTCVYLLGADHHGYVGRLRAMAACAGDDPDRTLEVLIGQLVKIVRGDEEVRLSKRAGDLVTLLELMDEIGVDALRYSLARYPSDSPLTLDIEQITRASSDNPVYYVQYAHARVSSLLRNARELGIDGPADASLLTHEREGDLLRGLAEYPRTVQGAADLREPHRVARYLEELAGTYHRFYDTCRVLPMGDEDVTDLHRARLLLVEATRTVLHRARLLLVEATRTVLANGLGLLGVSAPERM